jgi:hypothetical protein
VFLSSLGGREEAEFFEAPVGVVGVDDVGDGGSERFDGTEGSAVGDLLVEGAVEALGDAVGLRLFDEGEAGSDPPLLESVLEVVGSVALRAPSASPGAIPGRSSTSFSMFVLSLDIRSSPNTCPRKSGPSHYG